MMSRIEELSLGLQESERQREAGARSAMLGLEDRAEAEARGRRVAEAELKDARVEVSALKSEVMNLRLEYQRVTSEREREGGRGDKRMKSKVEGLEERCRVLRDEADHGMNIDTHTYTYTRLPTCSHLPVSRPQTIVIGAHEQGIRASTSSSQIFLSFSSCASMPVIASLLVIGSSTIQTDGSFSRSHSKAFRKELKII
jgi:hypothetical protein